MPVKSKYQCSMGKPLDMLAEECSELIKEIMKANRFGLIGIKSYEGSKPKENIIQEIGDVLALIEIVMREHNFSYDSIATARKLKFKRLRELFGYEFRYDIKL